MGGVVLLNISLRRTMNAYPDVFFCNYNIYKMKVWLSVSWSL